MPARTYQKIVKSLAAHFRNVPFLLYLDVSNDLQTKWYSLHLHPSPASESKGKGGYPMVSLGEYPNHAYHHVPNIYGVYRAIWRNIQETIGRVLSQGYPHLPFDIQRKKIPFVGQLCFLCAFSLSPSPECSRSFQARSFDYKFMGAKHVGGISSQRMTTKRLDKHTGVCPKLGWPPQIGPKWFHVRAGNMNKHFNN